MKTPEPKKLKSGTWFIQLRLTSPEGQLISVPVSAESKKECIRQAELVKAEHRSGRKVVRSAQNKTLREAAKEYIASRSESLSPSTRRGYNAIINTRFKDAADKPLGSIDWQRECNNEAKLCSAKTLKNSWGFVASVLRSEGQSVPEIRLPQVIPAERPWLDPDEITRFLAALRDTPAEIPALLALHSLRRSEICALTWEKLDLRNGIIYVEGAAVFDEKHKLTQKPTNKNNSSRRAVPIMIPRLTEILEAAEDKTGLVVRCNPDTIWARVNRVCRAASLPEVGVHGLRHSFASLAYHLGLSEVETMKLGGWSDTQTMRKIYTHLYDKDRLNAANKMLEFYKTANENANG